MTNIEKKDVIQRQAIKEWIKCGKKGTCEITTGVGKTFIGLHALYEMPKNDDIHLFLAEVIDRKTDLLEQISLYNKIFNRDVTNDYKIKFLTYQSAYKLKGYNIGLIIADEIHDSLTEAYVKVYTNNRYKAIIGLSATIDVGTYYPNIKKTKGDLINEVAPICFKYDLAESIENGTSRKLEVYVIQHHLNKVAKVIKAGSVKKPFYQTEESAYKYWDNRFIKTMGSNIDYSKKPGETDISYTRRVKKLEDDRERLLTLCISRRANILYDLPSKIGVTKTLIKHLVGKTIVFSNGLTGLIKTVQNVVSSKNTDKINESIKDDFQKGIISIIGSFKKLKQGVNLKDLDNVVQMSYYSKEKDFYQRVGRLRDDGTIGKVFIFVTMYTQEEEWFTKMVQNIPNIKMIYCNDIFECINKIK